jgi:polyadenylate-binding protein
MSYGYPFQNMPMMDPMNQGKLPLAPALYVGEIDRHIQEETLYDFFSKFGPIHFVRIMRDANTGQSRGYGFVNFVYPRDADAAKKYGQYEKLGEKHIRIMFKRNIRDLPSESNIYIKKIGPEINVRELDNHFSAIGPLVCCKIASTPDGRSLGYGYVQYENKDDAKTALEQLQGSKLKETVLDLAEFIPKEKKKKFN